MCTPATDKLFIKKTMGQAGLKLAEFANRPYVGYLRDI